MATVKTYCGKSVKTADEDVLVTNGARTDFGDDEGKRCPECYDLTPPYPQRFARVGDVWHAVRED